MKRDAITALALLAALSLCTVVSAENSTREGIYTVHHNAIPTAILTPEIAGSYNIVRSKYRGLLNISVIQEKAGTTGTAVTAEVRAQSINLIGKIQDIAMREIREEQAIYYIGEYPIVDNETLTFNLEVTPSGSEKPIKSSLKQQFFID
ncbi:MAG: DUF4426 domain-containing protein [Gammaproteobacteria bacterium]|nr:DUF4426 domain-containing protein [Gammaproteobacteria bacterium]